MLKKCNAKIRVDLEYIEISKHVKRVGFGNILSTTKEWYFRGSQDFVGSRCSAHRKTEKADRSQGPKEVEQDKSGRCCCHWKRVIWEPNAIISLNLAVVY